MHARAYLPSKDFSVIVGSMAIAGGLIVAAYYVTRPQSIPVLESGDVVATQNEDWKAALDAVQAEAPGLPPAPDEEQVAALKDAAKSSNVTASVARSLLVTIGEAGAQGLGSDIPTQERLIGEATAQLEAKITNVYASSDLSIVTNTNASARAWGNAVVQAFNAHPKASKDAALYAIAYASDYNDSKALEQLSTISREYAALAADLADIPVPSPYAPLYLYLVNDLSKMATAAGEMKTVLEDPLRGLAGLQVFQTSSDEASRVLTTLAEQLSKGGILFTKDEPGHAWNAFVSAYAQ
jgi:hypothetical protein